MQILSLLLSIPLLIAPAGEKESSVAPSTVQSLADAFVESELAPGIAIGVVDESGRIRTYCAGTLKVGGEQPVTEDTIFEIGSITKVFTATLAHLLEQRGELSLSDPVGVHLPDEIDVKVVDGNEILLWHLATHTSGLPRMPDNTNDNQPDPHLGYTNAQLYEFLEKTGPERAPGQEYVYSNIGMGLLGHVLELNQDASYEELVQQHILKPLKMSRTRCTPRDSDASRVATAHSGRQPASAWDVNGPMAGAGNLNSSLRDMMKFARANLSDLNTQLHRSMRACQIPRVKGKSGGRVGLAWHVIGESSERIIHHGGGTGGFRSFMAFMPDRGRAVVVLANSTHDVGTLGRHILAPDIVGIEQLPLLVAIPTYQPRQPINLDEYVGSYRSASDARFVVENRNGELFARLDKQNFFAFRPIGEDLFLFDQVNARLRFEHDAQGRVTTLILKQNGHETHYLRELLVAIPTYQPRQPINLDEYVGSYRSASDARFVVENRNGELFARLNKQNFFAFRPIGEDLFLFDQVNARLRFEHDAQGRVTTLILKQNGHETHYLRELLVAIPTYQPRQPINLDEYVGSYRSASDARFVVENRNGELFARLNKQNFFAFRPIGEDLFLFDQVNARLRFEHDAQGRVTTLILKQNGHETHYLREF